MLFYFYISFWKEDFALFKPKEHSQKLEADGTIQQHLYQPQHKTSSSNKQPTANTSGKPKSMNFQDIFPELIEHMGKYQTLEILTK